ncbi:MAG: manganese efflux pump [Firmicutes bacterium]|nr:manganese efflux pump [Bacillota bacterium]
MAVALGTDAMSLSVGIGLRGVSRQDVLRVSFVVGLFHIIMPLAGIVLGHLFGLLVGELARWLGALIVAFIGARMIWGCLGTKECLSANWVLSGLPLMLLAGSVSMDALSVGFSLGAFGYNVFLASAIFGLFGAAMTGLGLVFGSRLGDCVGDRAELIGGGVLVILAIHMLLEG